MRPRPTRRPTRASRSQPGVLPAESYAQAITTRLQGGNAPDVFQAESGSGQTDSIQSFAKGGLLLPITDPAVKTELTRPA